MDILVADVPPLVAELPHADLRLQPLLGGQAVDMLRRAVTHAITGDMQRLAGPLHGVWLLTHHNTMSFCWACRLVIGDSRRSNCKSKLPALYLASLRSVWPRECANSWGTHPVERVFYHSSARVSQSSIAAGGAGSCWREICTRACRHWLCASACEAAVLVDVPGYSRVQFLMSTT